jgi:hypothetical protein
MGNVTVRKLIAAVVGLVLVSAITAVSLEEKKAPPREYAGSKKCRICHNVPSKGKMHDIWKKSNHAHAYETLLTKEAKEAAKKLGIDKPQKSGECLRCHATAYGFTKKLVAKKVKVEEGVGCESCHGAGKDYSNLTVMKDREKAMAAGLVYPAKDVCTRCHNTESPTWNPERYTDKDGNKVGFDYEVLWEMIKHSTPEK